MSGLAEASFASVLLAGLGRLGFVPEMCGLAGLVGYGMVGSCTVCLGLAGEVR